MKWVWRILGWLVLLLVVVAVAAVVFRDVWLKRTLQRTVRNTSGLEVEMEGFRSTMVPPSVHVTGLDIKNPPGFGEDEAFRIDELFVSVERATLFSDEIRLPEVRFRVPRMIVIQDEQGRTNLERLGRELNRARTAGGRTPGEPSLPPSEPGSRPEAPAPAPSRVRSFRIARLETYVGEIEYREQRRGEAEPRVRIIRVDREVVFEDVTDLQVVAQQLAVQWAAAALPSLLEQTREGGDAGDALRGLQDMLRQQRRARREASGP